jgi:alpha-galactosidase
MTKITIVGAGSIQFGSTILGEIFQSEVLREAQICLHDINASALAHMHKLAQDYLERNSLPHTLVSTTEAEIALKDADFVIIAIEVGNRFELWEQDWQIPQQFGIPQVYGENGGPGGLFHALRILPPILELCGLIQKNCPEALVLNFSNPMSRICTTVHHAYPDLNFVGLCHEIANAIKDVPAILSVGSDEVHFVAAGLNHFSCVLEAHYYPSKNDAYPDLLAKAPAYYASLPGSSDFLAQSLNTGKIVETEGYLYVQHEISSTLRPYTERYTTRFFLEHFNLLPITSDSHFAEYLPWGYDIADHRGILDFYTYYRDFLCKVEAKITPELKERAIPIMEASVTNKTFREPAVNIPNRGCIATLPADIAVEVPATFKDGKFTGEQITTLPEAFSGLLQNQVAVHQLTSEAVLNKSKKAVHQALLVDPTVPTAARLSELIECMLLRQAKYLGYLE